MKHGIRTLLLVCFYLFSTMASAALHLELTQGIDAALPIAIIPFNSPDAELPMEISEIIRDDLQHSGRFSVMVERNNIQDVHFPQEVHHNAWREKDIDYVIVGHVKNRSSDNWQVEFALVETYKSQGTTLLHKEFNVTTAELRRLAHRMSDIVYEQLVGNRGIFSTQIAYVLVERVPGKPPRYQLEVADFDGYNPQTLVSSASPIMSPSWSPDGRSIAYVSFENKKSEIYSINIRSGERQLISSFPGINGAPAWSPDSKQLAFVLSQGGSPNIYIRDISNDNIKQVTNGWSISTEPSWTPDGKSIIFTSNRGGGPQIYRVNLETLQVNRVTYTGTYNARGSYSSDGRNLVVLHRSHGVFNIAVQDSETDTLRTLTRTGMDESPVFAPNGSMILYATQYGGRGVLALVSVDGKVKLRLPSRQGDVQEPTWSPFLEQRA